MATGFCSPHHPQILCRVSAMKVHKAVEKRHGGGAVLHRDENGDGSISDASPFHFLFDRWRPGVVATVKRLDGETVLMCVAEERARTDRARLFGSIEAGLGNAPHSDVGDGGRRSRCSASYSS
jgi:hypothetical protein